MNPKYFLLILLLTFVNITSCRKYIEVDAPKNSTNSINVYSDNTTAAAVLTGIYTSLSLNTFTSSPSFNSLSFFAGLSADEFTLYSSVVNLVQISYYSNTLNSGASGTAAGPEFWNTAYPIVYRANSAIEGLSNSSQLSDNVKQQLLGEAKFIRALSYFYLTNLYGDVPLTLTSDVTVNASSPRSPKQDVYQQIITDLKDAQQLLSSNYVGSDAITATTERTRPNKWVATALLSRVYLYNKDWQNAEDQATSLISQQSIYDTVSFSSSIKVFDKNSKEAIWQLQPVKTGQNTPDAISFILPSSGPGPTFPVYLRDTLLAAFEFGDKRKTNWTSSVTASGKTYYYPYKYKVNSSTAPLTEYVMVFRLAEQYLIRAEARALQNKIADAQTDLNVIRKRAGLSTTNANDQPSLLAAILHERQVELFSEWGHRWFDLKRTDNVDAVMSGITPKKGGTWETTDKLYPLPVTDVQRNINIEQNQGY